MCCSHSSWTQCKYTPGLCRKCHSLNEQGFFIFSLFIVYLIFFSVLYMLLQMCWCNLSLLLLRHWRESNLSRAVSTFQCNSKVLCVPFFLLWEIHHATFARHSPWDAVSSCSRTGPLWTEKCIPEQILPWCCDKRVCYGKLEKLLSKCITQ